MNSLTIVEQDQQGNLFTTSEAIAKGAGVEHRAVLQMIEKYKPQVERFGTVAFEVRPLPGGGNPVRTARLTEQQASFILTLARNTEQVVNFKADLVAEFDRMAQALKTPALTEDEIVHQALQITHQKVQQLEAERRVLKPKAEFADTFLAGGSDYDARDAAQILARDKGITDMGQNRLMRWLRKRGWLDSNDRPYQAKVDAGYLCEKPYPPVKNKRTGTEFTPKPQIRITARGIEALARQMKVSTIGEAA